MNCSLKFEINIHKDNIKYNLSLLFRLLYCFIVYLIRPWRSFSFITTWESYAPTQTWLCSSINIRVREVVFTYLLSFVWCDFLISFGYAVAFLTVIATAYSLISFWIWLGWVYFLFSLIRVILSAYFLWSTVSTTLCSFLASATYKNLSGFERYRPWLTSTSCRSTSLTMYYPSSSLVW